MFCVDVLPPKLVLQMSYAPDQQQPPWSGSEKVRGNMQNLEVLSFSGAMLI